ncbi:MAG: N-acetylglucosamine kinase [Candidatus Bathyarchaeia archaeon]
MDYVLGIDGGGTKTACVISDTEGRLLGGAISGGSNYLTVGKDETAKSIRDAIKKASERCHVKIPRFKLAYLGMAGSGRPSGIKVIKRIMEDLDVAEKVIIDIDASIALAGAITCKPGVVVISGTGSIAFGINKKGESKRVGGWGYLWDDEGSGFEIGRRGLTAAFRAYDGRGEETLLLNRLISHFEVRNVDDLLDRIYSGGVKINAISSLAPLVIEAARDGDTVSLKILRDTVEELSLSAMTVIRNLKMECDEFELALMGGVFKAKDLIALPVQKRIKSFAPKCKVIAPRFKPVVGAILMALKELNIQIDKSVLSSVEATLHNVQNIF